MVRKIAVILMLLLLAAAFLPVGAAAAAPEIRIEQVQSEMPELRAWFYADGAAPGTVTATLGGTALELSELRQYDPEKDGISYFFLVDCSTSTTSAQIAAVKSVLNDFAADLPHNATVTLISFGVEVKILLDRESDGAAIREKVATLAANEDGTLFFDALAKTISAASAKEYALERKVAFIFSDAVDYNLGGYTKAEIDDLLDSAGFPIYALGFNTGSKEGLDNFGAVARRSGGEIAVVSPATLPDAFAAMRSHIDNTMTARFTAPTNLVEPKQQTFSLQTDVVPAAAAKQIALQHWRPDTTAPGITAIEQQSAESIKIIFSEAVQGASDPESYNIKNKAGDLLGIQAAAYDETERSVVLTFSAPPNSGTYTVDCPGVTDVSMERNPVASGSSFSFRGTAGGGGVSPVAWAVLAVGILGIIVIAAVISSRKRAAAAAAVGTTAVAATGLAAGSLELEQAASYGSEMQVHFSQSAQPLPKVRLQVTNHAGSSRTVDVPVNKTLFVGRSDVCEIYFDDTAMSRQHFVISEDNGVYTLTNLSETGGTVLNGVRLNNPRALNNGDVIEAGRQKIAFYALPPESGVQ